MVYSQLKVLWTEKEYVMRHSCWTRIVVVAILLFGVCHIEAVFAYVRGIYVSQPTAQNTKKMQYFIREAKASGINTFVVDVKRMNTVYARNIKMMRKAGIRYVARVVIFPGGGTHAQVTNQNIWAARWRLANYAIKLGAKEIQLDYIRYNTRVGSSKQNSRNVLKVVQYFKKKMAGTGVKLQVDIFGVAAHKPSHRIGQSVPLLATTVDAICPMVYPSHYEPYKWHAVRPYNTVLKSVDALVKQLRKQKQVKVYAWIELSNYRYPMSRAKKASYIDSQLQAAHDAGAQGWYAWSARNQYGLLFSVLKSR